MSDKLDAGPYWGNEAIDPGFVAVQKLATDCNDLRAENERLRAALDMIAEERDSWKARALGLPQEPCRHLDSDKAR